MRPKRGVLAVPDERRVSGDSVHRLQSGQPTSLRSQRHADSRGRIAQVQERRPEIRCIGKRPHCGRLHRWRNPKHAAQYQHRHGHRRVTLHLQGDFGADASVDGLIQPRPVALSPGILFVGTGVAPAFFVIIIRQFHAADVR